MITASNTSCPKVIPRGRGASEAEEIGGSLEPDSVEEGTTSGMHLNLGPITHRVKV
jgi:hypothetical protein